MTDSLTDTVDTAGDLPENLILSANEARVLGCLIEKEATTPNQYPLTENGLMTACNQKTSRNPVMELSSGDVGHALRQLESRKIVRGEHGSRAQRWEHRFAQAYGVTRHQQAALCILLLRGPQTLNEILSRGERIAGDWNDELLTHALERLQQREPTLVICLPKAPGQREERWMHLLSGPVDPDAWQAEAGPAASRSNDALAALEARIEALEARIEALESRG